MPRMDYGKAATILKKLPSRVLLLLLCMASVFVKSGCSQGFLAFPRVISDSDLFTGIAVCNPTTLDASVTFTAFLPDGTALSGFGLQNPVTLTIPAGSQVAKEFGEIFVGVTGPFNGWVQATSAVAGLTGLGVNGNFAQTDLDGVGSIMPSTDFTLPFTVEDTDVKTEVTIVNVNSDPA